MGSQGWPKTTKGSPGGPNYINKLPINRPSGHYVNKDFYDFEGFENQSTDFVNVQNSLAEHM